VQIIPAKFILAAILSCDECHVQCIKWDMTFVVGSWHVLQHLKASQGIGRWLFPDFQAVQSFQSFPAIASNSNLPKEVKMSYRVTDRANGVVGGIFQNPAEARVVIDEILAEGTENEVNWLMELVHATHEGGAVNMGDEGYVTRIIAANEADQHQVAVECAIERICADYEIVMASEE
jgi:hypothetical protein